MYICSPSLYFTVIKLMEEAVLMWNGHVEQPNRLVEPA
jgi:hypothetical protein